MTWWDDEDASWDNDDSMQEMMDMFFAFMRFKGKGAPRPNEKGAWAKGPPTLGKGQPNAGTYKGKGAGIPAFGGCKGGKGTKGSKGKSKGKGKGEKGKGMDFGKAPGPSKGKGKYTHNLDEALQQLGQFKQRNPDFHFAARPSPPPSAERILREIGEDKPNLYKRLAKYCELDPTVLSDTILQEMAANSYWSMDKLNVIEKERQERSGKSTDGRSSRLTSRSRGW